jgi:hypothetical protein
LQREHEEIIFPDAFIDPVGKISVEGHGKRCAIKLGRKFHAKAPRRKEKPDFFAPWRLGVKYFSLTCFISPLQFYT